ncbi:hypothetical protein CDD80_5939 [Ophiocordyceps camponoti-rufipedis]|uniref:Conserved oligomeric Golgi complex subunit 8 n=1 Tax=Ophiocordyceps camponoti-rufipedis TaxID=2004952 RepID=A0A2C5YM05_9HYPO|nr:hypothetical protein CDD80_5939 [Ophiocordyceps camponoti-rufipedis]
MVEALCEALGLRDEFADDATSKYLNHLIELPVEQLCSSEPDRLARESHSVLSSLQTLSKRSHQLIVQSAASHLSLRQNLPAFARLASELSYDVPALAAVADSFSSTFDNTGENQTIVCRKQSICLMQNAHRLVSITELPSLLHTAARANPVNYSNSLDLYAHARRLASLYPSSSVVSSVLSDADRYIRQIATELVVALESPGIKLAAGLRTVGWLKRVVSDLVANISSDETLPAVFLACRLATLVATLAALKPLRDLADGERLRRASSGPSTGGQQIERYLKRYIEIFREHAFGIVSMSKSIDVGIISSTTTEADALSPPSPPLSSFALYIIDLLVHTLNEYIPFITDRTSRNSIITQVLYCAGSLGRLGADFSVLLAALGIDERPDQIKRHRMLAGRLDNIIKGQSAPSRP